MWKVSLGYVQGTAGMSMTLEFRIKFGPQGILITLQMF